jgi:hypothetical protein
MSKVYKPGEKRKSLSECGCAAQCAEGGGDELCAWDPCACGMLRVYLPYTSLYNMIMSRSRCDTPGFSSTHRSVPPPYT